MASLCVRDEGLTVEIYNTILAASKRVVITRLSGLSKRVSG